MFALCAPHLPHKDGRIPPPSALPTITGIKHHYYRHNHHHNHHQLLYGTFVRGRVPSRTGTKPLLPLRDSYWDIYRENQRMSSTRSSGSPAGSRRSSHFSPDPESSDPDSDSGSSSDSDSDSLWTTSRADASLVPASLVARHVMVPESSEYVSQISSTAVPPVSVIWWSENAM